MHFFSRKEYLRASPRIIKGERSQRPGIDCKVDRIADGIINLVDLVRKLAGDGGRKVVKRSDARYNLFFI